MVGFRISTGLSEARIDLLARVVALCAGVVLAIGTAHLAAATSAVLVLSVTALGMTAVAVLAGTSGPEYRYCLIGEAVLAAAVLVLAAPVPEVAMVYLSAPAFLAGLRAGPRVVAVVALAEVAGVLTATLRPGAAGSEILLLETPWVALAVVAGLLGSWVRRLETVSVDSHSSPYASAYRLLGQLRTITRELPGGLDLEVVSENVLSNTMAGLNGERAALLFRHDSDTPDLVAQRGHDGFPATLVRDPLVKMSMGLRRPMQQPEPHGRSHHRFRVCLPLIVGQRAIGAVVVDGPTAVSDAELAAVQQSLNDEALRLESAALFGDVKALATVEERHRLAREIHDGIAQEIASMGYLVDDLARYECNQRHQDGLVALRDELTRVVTELRLSIFDLRSGVSSNAGLGTVLGDYVRQVGKNSGMVVHMSLEESPQRLRLDVETELLRIAQEAVNNARKHSNGDNLWVTCRVEPPFAELRIEDDGRGAAAPRAEHYGLHTMKERAARINAVLTIGSRVGGGTVVSAVLLPAEAAAAVPHLGESHALHRLAG